MKANRSLAAVILTYAVLMLVTSGFGILSAPATALGDGVNGDVPIGSDTLHFIDTTTITKAQVTEPALSAWDLFLLVVESAVL